MRIFEKVFVALAAIGLGFKVLSLTGGNEFLMLGLMLLACLYFYLGFALLLGLALKAVFKKSSYANVSTLRIWGSVGAGILLSIVLTGVLFKLLILPGASEMLLIGDSGLLILLGVALFMVLIQKKPLDPFYKNIFLRVAIVLILGLSLLATSTNTLLRFFHRHEPAYVELLIKARENPNDPEIQRELEEAAHRRGY